MIKIDNIVIIGVLTIFCVLFGEMSCYRQQNKTLEEKVSLQDETIEDLNKDVSTLRKQISLIDQTRSLENQEIKSLIKKIEETQENKKFFDVSLDKLKNSEGTDDKTKNWLDDPIPDDIRELLDETFCTI